MCVEAYDFSRVSPTALYPVIARGKFTDIPFAKEILDRLKASETFPADAYSPAFFEARFKSVSRFIAGLGFTQVLELAAGFSPRGMDLCRRGVVYVETDLPEMIEQKRSLVTALLGSTPANLHFAAASVLDPDALLAACACLDRGKPVAVATEGLLRYLTFEEKTVLAGNVHAILTRFGAGAGSAWITPDIHLKRWVRERPGSFTNRLVKRLGREISPNYFDNSAHARAFFESCGFTVEERPLLEGVRASVASLALAPAYVLEELEQRQTFILRAE